VITDKVLKSDKHICYMAKYISLTWIDEQVTRKKN